MKKQDKSDFVSSLSKELKTAKSAVFVDFAGMGVKPQQELKKELKKASAKMLVGKNTLIKIAGREAKLPEEVLTDSVLSGQTAIILTSNDPVSTIQIIGKFFTENNFPKMKAAILEGDFQNIEKLTLISKLPSREVLVGQVIGAVASPLYGMVSILNSKMQELLFILNTKAGGDTNG